MSINNIYCNTKVYKELYKKGRREVLHSNPDNLAFYLFGNEVSGLDFEVIKKNNFQSAFGNIELAIIGSSHYFKLDNYFTEILTCSDKTIKNSAIVTSKQNIETYDYHIAVSKLLYRVSIQNIRYTDKNNFKKFELSLLSNEYFTHAFGKKSAVTALKYENNKNLFRLKTWHTYPEYTQVIYSQTEIYHK
jgi:hypothetical protein